MQKYTFSITIAALTVFIALLIACGEGESNNLEHSQATMDKIKGYMDALIDPETGYIYECAKTEKDECPPKYEPPTGGDESSGSQPPEDENCPENIKSLLQSINFACSWSPSSVKAGDKSKLSLPSYTSPSPSIMTCVTSQKAWRYISEGGLKYDTAFFSLNQEIKTSGPYLDMKLNGRLLSEDSSKQWPISSSNVDFKVNGRIICSGVADGKSYTCSTSRECTPLVISPATAPIGNNITLTCNWQTLPVGTNNLAKGISPPACTSTGSISNQNEAGCDSPTPTIEYCGGTALSSCDFSKAGTVTVKAVATCKGGKYALKTLTYNVRDESSIGACTWDKERYIVAQKDVATPSVSITNNSGCQTTFEKNFPRQVIASDVGTLNIKATVNCGISKTVDCPAVPVVNAVYEITKQDVQIDIPNGSHAILVNIPSSGWVQAGHTTATFACNGDNTGMKVIVETGASAVTITGDHYMNGSIPIDWTINSNSLQVNITNCTNCKCKIGW